MTVARYYIGSKYLKYVRNHFSRLCMLSSVRMQVILVAELLATGVTAIGLLL